MAMGTGGDGSTAGEARGVATGFDAVIGLEQAALDRWCRGDPSGFLDLADAEVTYFDPFLPERLDGLAALTAHYEGLRGKIRADSWRMIDPKVTVVGEAAVLTFRFASRAGGDDLLWNATEVYRATPAGPRIVHTQWAFAARA
jgi:hypothetical protein